MNYLKVYCALIRKAESRKNLNVYTESHHVFPKSIFGKNNRIAKLTAREHFLAHLLLEKALRKRYGSKNRKTRSALHAVIYMGQKYKNSRLYAAARERFALQMSGKGAPKSKLTEKEVQVIRWYLYSQEKYTYITKENMAKFFLIKQCTIDQIIKKRTWKHVKNLKKLPRKYNYLPLLIKMGVTIEYIRHPTRIKTLINTVRIAH